MYFHTQHRNQETNQHLCCTVESVTGQHRLFVWAAGHPTTIFRHSLFSAITSLGCCCGPQSVTLFWHNSQALGAHFEGAVGGTGFTLTCRQHGAASWAQSGLFTEMPRCAKQLVCRQLWPVSTCGLGELAVTAGALVLAEGVQPGTTAHALTQTCRAAAMVMVQNHSALARPLLCRHRGPWWTWGQTVQRGRTAQL